MTDVSKNKNQLISTPAEARALYAPAPAEYRGKIGLEVEMPLYRPGASGVEIPAAAEMEAMQAHLRARGFDAQLEAAGVLEYASPPVPLAAAPTLAAQARADLAVFEQAAAGRGYLRAPFCVLPTTTPGEARDKKVGRARLAAAIATLDESFPPGTANVPLLTTGVQTSFSPADPEEMFRMARRAYALTPLLYAMTNSSAGFAENAPARKDHNLRGKYYEFYGAAGGIAESFLKSANGEDYVRHHIEAVFDTPMLFAYEPDGALLRPAKGETLTFRSLAARGLNTQSNYELAESFIYNDVKICNLRDPAGAVVGKRLEVRAADSGPHQPFDALLLTAALVPEGPTARAFEALLCDYGFTLAPPADAALLKAARRNAVEHGGNFMAVAFGRDPATGAPRSLRDFAADVAGLISAHYADAPRARPEVAKLCELLLTGDCDAKLHAAKFPALADVVRHLQAANENTPPAPEASQNSPPPAGLRRSSSRPE